MAAGGYNPWAQQVFNLSRDFILTYPTPIIQVADRVTASTTKSTYRLHWNSIGLWPDFSAQVIAYWNAVPPNDKQSNVYTQDAYTNRFQAVSSGFSQAANEGNVKDLLHTFVTDVQNAAANGLHGAPRPSDRHSRLQKWEHGVEANAVAGVPDLVMVTEHAANPRRITAILEVKNPWQVTPALVDEVIQS